MEINAGTLALTKTLKCTPHGGGSNSNHYALQEIEIEQSKINAIRSIFFGQLTLLRNSMDSRINQA